MAATLLKAQLQTFIQGMYNEGVVNDQFFQLQLMKEASPPLPDFAIRTVTRYCIACTRLFSALTQLISQGEVDFPSVHYHASDLYARTCGIGAENVRCACAELLQACERKDKNHCSQALYWVKNRFACSRIKLETFVQEVVNDQFIRLYYLESTRKPDCAAHYNTFLR